MKKEGERGERKRETERLRETERVRSSMAQETEMSSRLCCISGIVWCRSPQNDTRPRVLSPPRPQVLCLGSSHREALSRGSKMVGAASVSHPFKFNNSSWDWGKSGGSNVSPECSLSHAEAISVSRDMGPLVGLG
uniref:Uncharacterized protein n=1 Tax=Rousettus aegyptiacus TaxID=9407 RepID=A0A7J8F0B4_ROUAE|nr:hypothetical protein HJG63_012348 [Rousettus aegyptiacus]